MSTDVRRLVPENAAEFQALRLRGLAETPTAFAASVEEEQNDPVADVAQRMRRDGHGFIVGAFIDGRLAGVVGMHRESYRKLAHKMYLWGMYVAPEARGRGVARQLIEEALRAGFAIEGIRQVNLGVNARNAAALALYKAMGFTEFGLERGCLLVDGVLQDEIHMVH